MIDSIVLEKPSSSTPYGGGGGRAIDRHNPIILNERRLDQSRIFPSSSPIIITSTTTSFDQYHHLHRHHLPELESESKDSDPKRKSVAISDDDNEPIKEVDFNPFISPTSSSRCLLSNKSKNFNYSTKFHVNTPSPPSHEHSDQPTPQPLQYNRLRFLDGDQDSPSSSPPKIPSILTPNKPMLSCNPMPSNKKHDNPPSSATPRSPSPPPPPPSPPSSDRVVVLEVSLHCRGCERKMKKHISKIEGVKSFKIEFMAKKVTVVGDVTPLAVLTSVLKVKNAKLLTPATISSSSSSQASLNGFQQQA